MNSIATGSPLTKETWEDFVERLKYHNEGEGVKRHITSNPIFTVQKLVRTYGVSEAYGNNRVILDVDSDSVSTEYDHPEDYYEKLSKKEKEELDEFANDMLDVSFLELPDYDQWELLSDLPDTEVIYYIENWEHVNSHFTREAAEAFIKRKSHDYDKLRIYVESEYWCWEFNEIVKAILCDRLEFKEN